MCNLSLIEFIRMYLKILKKGKDKPSQRKRADNHKLGTHRKQQSTVKKETPQSL